MAGSSSVCAVVAWGDSMAPSTIIHTFLFPFPQTDMLDWMELEC